MDIKSIQRIIMVQVNDGKYYYIDQDGTIRIENANVETNNKPKKLKQYRGIKFYKVK